MGGGGVGGRRVEKEEEEKESMCNWKNLVRGLGGGGACCVTERI